MNTKTIAIMNALKEMEDNELMNVWNAYCEANNYGDDEIFSMDLFNDFYSSYDAEEVARRCFYGHDIYGDESSFNPNREFFYLNGYGNPVSCDYIGYNEYADRFMGPIDADALADYIADNDETFENDTLEDVLAELEEGIQ